MSQQRDNKTEGRAEHTTQRSYAQHGNVIRNAAKTKTIHYLFAYACSLRKYYLHLKNKTNRKTALAVVVDDIHSPRAKLLKPNII